MTNQLNNMFDNETTEVSISSRSLAGTAQLTQLSVSLANDVLAAIAKDDFDKDLFAASKTDHSAMDKLIAATVDLSSQDLTFLDTCSEDEIDKMLKSQQSKRSRAKSKAMTKENYLSMLTGALAENLLRVHSGKDKHKGGSRRGTTLVAYTEEQVQQFTEDKEKLAKELRNVQSKKSIMKSKADFSESSDAWLALLEAESLLKGLRGTGTPTVIKVDETKDQLAALLADVDVDKLKAADGKDLIAKIQALVEAK